MNRAKRQPELAKGQLWKTEATYLQIVDRGKRLIQYKMMTELGKKAVKTQMSGVAAVESYLRINKGKLLKGAALVLDQRSCG